MDVPHRESGLFALRHAKSRANVDGVIASQPRNGDRAGIVSVGESQVASSAEGARFNGFPVTVLTSPFRRCIETAELFVAKAGIHVPEGIQVRHELVERDFGALEGGPKSGYKLVYAADAHGAENRAFGAESTHHVRERTGNLLDEVSDISSRHPVVLVTHADVGEIMQTVLLGLPANEHRLHVPKLRNAELRELPFDGTRR